MKLFIRHYLEQHLMRALLNIAFLVTLFPIVTFAQEIISAGGMDFVEMSPTQIKTELYGKYYVHRPSSGMAIDVDEGTLGIIITDKGLTLTHGFAQTIYPAQGSGNITGSVTETAEYYNGKWYKGSSGEVVLYAYLNYEININVMNFNNTVWAGNSTKHESKIGKTKGIFLRKYPDGDWLYISNNGKFTFKHYTDADIAELKAKRAAEQRRQEEKKKEQARIEAERQERERKIAEERKRKEEEDRVRKAEQERKERERQAAYNKWHKLYLDSINAGYVRGQECVDLGLSVVWATCNIGAKSPQKKGKEMCASDIKKNMNVQKGWRLPTTSEFQELFTKCTVEPVGGFLHYKYIKLVSKINGHSIIIPNAFGVVSDGVCIRLWASGGNSFIWKQRECGNQGGVPIYKHAYESEWQTGPNACGYLRCVINK